MTMQSTEQRSEVGGQTVSASVLLVGAGGNFWENQSIYIAPLHRCDGCVVRFSRQHNWTAGTATGSVVTRSRKSAGCNRSAVQYGGHHVDTDRFHCWRVLLSRRAIRRTPRSQHPVLEIAAGIRSTTLLSKATIPLVVLPLATFTIVVATQLVMMVWTSVLLISHGMSPASTWTYVPLFRNSFILLYGLAAIALSARADLRLDLLVSGCDAASDFSLGHGCRFSRSHSSRESRSGLRTLY